MDRVNICDVLIDNLTAQEVCHRIDNLIASGGSHYIVTPNTDHIVKLQVDETFQEIYRKASLVLADGMPLIWASKLFGTPLKEKLSGSDLFVKLCEYSAQKNYKLFFLGGRPGAVEKAADVLKKKYPLLNVVGTYSPASGFEHHEEENSKIVSMIKNSGADILFVGLGAPKQEKWIFEHKHLYNVPVSMGIGVSFDFVAGMVKRAPVWMQKDGLEWFWRLLMEPRHLWSRYLIHDMKFFHLIFKQEFRRWSDRQRH
ncbi:MAG: WecB/TagA/CpsF family glycosyltransferase [Victivallaceae bacterium]